MKLWITIVVLLVLGVSLYNIIRYDTIIPSANDICMHSGKVTSISFGHPDDSCMYEDVLHAPRYNMNYFTIRPCETNDGYLFLTRIRKQCSGGSGSIGTTCLAYWFGAYKDTANLMFNAYNVTIVENVNFGNYTYFECTMSSALESGKYADFGDFYTGGLISGKVYVMDRSLVCTKEHAFAGPFDDFETAEFWKKKMCS